MIDLLLSNKTKKLAGVSLITMVVLFSGCNPNQDSQSLVADAQEAFESEINFVNVNQKSFDEEIYIKSQLYSENFNKEFYVLGDFGGGELDPECVYDKPLGELPENLEKYLANPPSEIRVFGVVMSPGGLLYVLIPKPKFYGDLQKVKHDKEEWRRKVRMSRRSDYLSPFHSGSDPMSPLDFIAGPNTEIAFKLFNNKWYLDETNPFEIVPEAPSGKQVPFFNVKRDVNKKIAYARYIRTSDISKNHCAYSFELHLDSKESRFQTRLIIDPVIKNNGNQFP